MFRLNYSSVDDAFKLGSDQIKDVQEEIKKLKSIVLETSGIQKNEKPSSSSQKKKNDPERIWQPDTTEATFEKKEPVQPPPAEMSKGIQNPNIEDIVKKVLSEKYPEMNNAPLKSTNYEPVNATGSVSKFTETFKETFGELCSNIKNIVIFFIVSILVYIIISIYFDRR